MSEPRKHHFVPRFYLAGFTPGGSKDSSLYVLDRHSRRQWQSHLDDIACEKDYYMLELDGHNDPQTVESFFARVEDRGSDAIRHIVDHGELPEGEDYAKLVEFLAITAVRVPGVLNSVDHAAEQMLKHVAWEMTASEQRWRDTITVLEADGKKAKGISYEQMRDFVRSGAYTIDLNQNSRMQLLISGLKTAADALAARRWIVIRAPNKGPEFICSDRPLSYCWSQPNGNGWIPPGLGCPDTVVMFPVNKSMALVGQFDPPQRRTVVTAKGVGIINMWTALFASRFIYSGGPELAVTLRRGELGGKRQLLSFLKNVTASQNRGPAWSLPAARDRIRQGQEVFIDSRYHRLDDLRRLAAVLTEAGAGMLVLTHSDSLTEAQRVAIAPVAAVAKLKFV